MSEQDQRTEAPSQSRLRQAREEGRIAKSGDVLSIACLASGVALLVYNGSSAAEELGGIVRTMLGAAFTTETVQIEGQLQGAIESTASLFLPFALVAWGAVALAGFAQTGGAIRPSALAPDLTRINGMTGFAKLWSLGTMSRLGFSVAKIGVVLFALYLGVGRLMGDESWALFGANSALDSVASFWGDWTLVVAYTVLSLFVLAVLDWWCARAILMRELSMTPGEVAAEQREQMPRPEILARRRDLYRTIRQRANERNSEEDQS